MQCTADEIDRKKRQALAKLQARKSQQLHKPMSPHVASTGIPNQTFYSKHQFSPLKRVSNENMNNGATKSASTGPHSSYSRNAKTDNRLSFGQNVITVSCSLTSEDRFIACMSGFHAGTIDTFKTISSKSYDPNSRQWNFHIADYNSLISKLNLLRPEIVIVPIPKYVLKCCLEKKLNYSSFDLSKIDSELLNTLMPFQKDGVCFGIEKGGRCLIADDMGLGKTLQALAIADYYRTDWPLLIVTTTSMRNTWEEMIHKYLPSVPLMYTKYMTSGKDYIQDAQILIVSHDLMSRHTDILLERHFGVFIADESHTFKNFKAKCTKSAISLAKQAQRVILLSGTPALSRPCELYSQLSMIDEKFFGDFFEYSKRYCNGKKTQFGWDASGSSNLTELELVLAKKFLIRRTKDMVMQCLPNKQREVVTLDVNLLKFSEADKKCLSQLADSYCNKKSYEKHSALLAFFSETARVKIPAVCAYILQVLQEKRKFLVFAHHQKMLDAISSLLDRHGKKYIRIDGNTNPDQRKYFVDKFQVDDNYICAVLSITAANAGITLTAAQLVLFAELHWNPSILCQAESRAHRIGQDGEVKVKYLIAGGTADDSIWPLLQNKQDILTEVGLNKDSFKDASVSKQEITEDINLTNSLKKNDITKYFQKKNEDDEIQNALQSFLESDFDEMEGKDSLQDAVDSFFNSDDDELMNINLDF